jgi:hypothetical protein
MDGAGGDDGGFRWRWCCTGFCGALVPTLAWARRGRGHDLDVDRESGPGVGRADRAVAIGRQLIRCIARRSSPASRYQRSWSRCPRARASSSAADRGRRARSVPTARVGCGRGRGRGRGPGPGRARGCGRSARRCGSRSDGPSRQSLPSLTLFSWFTASSPPVAATRLSRRAPVSASGQDAVSVAVRGPVVRGLGSARHRAIGFADRRRSGLRRPVAHAACMCSRAGRRRSDRRGGTPRRLGSSGRYRSCDGSGRGLLLWPPSAVSPAHGWAFHGIPLP